MGSPEAANLLRAFDKNHQALEALAASHTIDLNALGALVAARAALVAEIEHAGLDEATIRGLHNRHKALERVLSAAKDAAAAQLERMASGKRALKHYKTST